MRKRARFKGRRAKKGLVMWMKRFILFGALLAFAVVSSGCILCGYLTGGQASGPTLVGECSLASDVCGNGRGWSSPNTDSHCTVADCCGWYVTTHVHDLGQKQTGPVSLFVRYAPGYNEGCSSNAVISKSADNATWTQLASIPVTTRDSADGSGWQKYNTTIPDVRDVRYVKVQIDGCYNDWSSVEVRCG